MKDDCIFCKLANGVFPTNKVYEDELVTAILDAGPATPGHTLILPKEHYDNLYELPEDLAAHCICVAKKLAVAMTNELAAEGVNLVQNNGEEAGQSVMHFHLHVIPRYRGVGHFPLWTPTEPDSEKQKELAARLFAATMK